MTLRLMPRQTPPARRATLASSLVFLLTTTGLASPVLAQTAGQQASSLPGSRADKVNGAETPKVSPGVKPAPAATPEQLNQQARAATPTGAPVATAATTGNPVALVRRITVQGNERIETGTILSYLPIAVGEGADAARIDFHSRPVEPDRSRSRVQVHVPVADPRQRGGGGEEAGMATHDDVDLHAGE